MCLGIKKEPRSPAQPPKNIPTEAVHASWLSYRYGYATQMAAKRGLYANINAKKKAGKKPRKPGSKGAPSAADFKAAAKTAKKPKKKK